MLVLLLCLDLVVGFNQKLHYHDQMRTHFHTPCTEKGTFKQRYWVVEDHYKSPGPVFLYLCGEYECPGVPESRLFPLQLAEHFKAKFIVLEHRYYGSSFPYLYSNKLSEFLDYFTVEEALADTAQFIREMNKSLPPSTKWVIIGGSYAGAMSAWFRTRYPDLVIGSWASSAVVKPILEYSDFDKQVYLSAALSGQDCVDGIRNVTKYVETALKQGKIDEVTDIFKATKYFEKTQDKTPVLFYVTDIMAELIQYSHRTELCSGLVSDTDPVTQLKYINDINTKYDFMNPSEYAVDSIKDLNWQSSKSTRQWYWQKTTQMGFFQTASEYKMRSDLLNMTYWNWFVNQLFPYPGGISLPDMTIVQSGLNYGGTNIIYTNGVEDPWRWASLSEPTNSEQIVRLINCTDCGHCIELYTPNENDSEELQSAREMVKNTISSWINDS